MVFVQELFKDGMEDTHVSTLRYEQSIRETTHSVCVWKMYVRQHTLSATSRRFFPASTGAASSCRTIFTAWTD